MPRVAMVFTGGTISMQPDAQAGGNRPMLDGAAILARAPLVGKIADVDPLDWGMVPASHLRFADLLDIARLLERELARPEISGAVVVQGTDTIEETAFAWDLLVGSGKPVAVTGAMRDAADAAYDGPRNLADAVSCVVADAARECGVMVVLNGSIVAADDVVKSHSTAMDTFRPRDGRPLGSVVDGEVRIDQARTGRRRLPSVPATTPEDVQLVHAAVGADGSLLRGLAASAPAGLVVAGTGSGNTHPDLLAAAVELMAAGTVVCLTTRAAHGSVTPAYAFPGGGATWQRAGALLSPLDAPKTRVALALGLGAGLDRAALAELLAGPRR